MQRNAHVLRIRHKLKKNVNARTSTTTYASEAIHHFCQNVTYFLCGQSIVMQMGSWYWFCGVAAEETPNTYYLSIQWSWLFVNILIWNGNNLLEWVCLQKIWILILHMHINKTDVTLAKKLSKGSSFIISKALRVNHMQEIWKKKRIKYKLKSIVTNYR